MALPDFAKIEFRSRPDGELQVNTEGKVLGFLVQHSDGSFCVRLLPQVLRSINPSERPPE